MKEEYSRKFITYVYFKIFSGYLDSSEEQREFLFECCHLFNSFFCLIPFTY